MIVTTVSQIFLRPISPNKPPAFSTSISGRRMDVRYQLPRRAKRADSANFPRGSSHLPAIAMAADPAAAERFNFPERLRPARTAGRWEAAILGSAAGVARRALLSCRA